MTSTPASAKTTPRAMVPIMPSSSMTLRVRGLIRDVCRYFMNLRRMPSLTRTRPAMTTTSPTMPTSHRPPVCCMAVAVMSCCWRDWLRARPEITSNVR